MEDSSVISNNNSILSQLEGRVITQIFHDVHPETFIQSIYFAFDNFSALKVTCGSCRLDLLESTLANSSDFELTSNADSGAVSDNFGNVFHGVISGEDPFPTLIDSTIQSAKYQEITSVGDVAVNNQLQSQPVSFQHHIISFSVLNSSALRAKKLAWSKGQTSDKYVVTYQLKCYYRASSSSSQYSGPFPATINVELLSNVDDLIAQPPTSYCKYAIDRCPYVFNSMQALLLWDGFIKASPSPLRILDDIAYVFESCDYSDVKIEWYKLLQTILPNVIRSSSHNMITQENYSFAFISDVYSEREQTLKALLNKVLPGEIYTHVGLQVHHLKDADDDFASFTPAVGKRTPSSSSFSSFSSSISSLSSSSLTTRSFSSSSKSSSSSVLTSRSSSLNFISPRSSSIPTSLDNDIAPKKTWVELHSEPQYLVEAISSFLRFPIPSLRIEPNSRILFRIGSPSLSNFRIMYNSPGTMVYDIGKNAIYLDTDTVGLFHILQIILGKKEKSPFHGKRDIQLKMGGKRRNLE